MTLFQKIKLWLRFKVYARWRANFFPSYYLSHSQYGEDMIARSLLDFTPRGAFVDIGAHHPIHFSNTYHFYCRGWRGINIDAMPGSMEAFRTLRPGDTNLELCISDRPDVEVTFYMFGPGSPLNTISVETAEEHKRTYGIPIAEERKLRTRTLAQVLDEHLKSQEMDLLTVDIEGMDEQILRSNDWTRYRPKVVIFERHGAEQSNIAADPLVAFLTHNGYQLSGMCGPSFIMRRQDWLRA